MNTAYEKRPVIGMIALVWLGLAVGAVAASTSGVMQLVAILAFGSLAVGYRTIEGRGGMLYTTRAAHPFFRLACGFTATAAGVGFFAFAFGAAGPLPLVGALVALAVALTAWHFAPPAGGESRVMQ